MSGDFRVDYTAGVDFNVPQKTDVKIQLDIDQVGTDSNPLQESIDKFFESEDKKIKISVDRGDGEATFTNQSGRKALVIRDQEVIVDKGTGKVIEVVKPGKEYNLAEGQERKRVVLAETLEPGKSAKGDAVILDSNADGHFGPEDLAFKTFNKDQVYLAKDQMTGLPSVQGGDESNALLRTANWLRGESPDKHGYMDLTTLMNNMDGSSEPMKTIYNGDILKEKQYLDPLLSVKS